MTAISFWNDPQTLEPKRDINFLLSVRGLTEGIENYLVQKVKKPGFELGVIDVHFLNHIFHYPGKVKWDEVTLEIIDAVNPNSSKSFLKMLEQSGYRAPQGPVEENGPNAQTISKRKSIQALGEVRIKQLDPDGNLTDTWVLKNAFVKKVEFGELKYEGDGEVMKISLTLTYDYAFCEFKDPVQGQNAVPINSNTLPSNAT